MAWAGRPSRRPSDTDPRGSRAPRRQPCWLCRSPRTCGAPWSFADRGLVREGQVADLNVFDAERIGPDMPTLVNDLPAGGQRIIQRAKEITATIVGGQTVLCDGEP